MKQFQLIFLVLLATAGLQAQGVVINEVLASNDSVQADQDGEYDDYIELYNSSTSTIDLSGYYLSDDASNLSKWRFPNGNSIAASGFLVVWADDDTLQSGLHANFKVSATNGETIFLSDASSSLLDSLQLSPQTTDISYGRFPDGSSMLQTMLPTFNGQNSGSTGILSIADSKSGVKLYPNPTTDVLNLKIDRSDGEYELLVYDLQGSVILREMRSGNQLIRTADWTPGIYFLRAGDYTARIVKQ